MDAIFRRSLGFVSLLLLVVPVLVTAQQRVIPPRQPARPAADRAKARTPTARKSRLPRSRLQAPELRVQKLDPKLRSTLEKWERATAGIKTLQGEIYRYHREFVFNTEKRARGVFYFEAPDKGRLDILSVKIPKGTVSRVKLAARKDPRTKQTVAGRSVVLAVASDKDQKWVCDGTQILEMNDVDRTVASHPIPEQYRGRNIMDGPLPFLFGMPVEKAVRRYQMDLLGASEKEVWLRAWPKWRQDAANYREATVILDATTYLPSHVRLTAPDNSQTIYSFARLKVNSKFSALAKLFPGGNPFRPSLSRYRILAARSAPVVPTVIGLPWKAAREKLTRAGYKIKFVSGRPATKQKLLYVVYEQQPRERAPLAPGGQITLTFFSKPAAGGSR